MNRLIIITGGLANGKSTLATSLADYFHADLYIKDLIKEALVDQEGFSNREENLALSYKAVNYMIEQTKNSLSSHHDVICEANFRHEQILQLIDIAKRNNAKIDVLLITCDIEISYQRFLKRVPFRHKAHLSMGLDQDFTAFKAYNAMILGQIDGIPNIEIDSTNLDPEALKERVVNLLEE